MWRPSELKGIADTFHRVCSLLHHMLYLLTQLRKSASLGKKKPAGANPAEGLRAVPLLLHSLSFLVTTCVTDSDRAEAGGQRSPNTSASIMA